ncbi:MAG: polysaccharide pyruvyl transferase family protein [Bacteroidaceae bacterium]|nr:polysaccharide pyruvyl transferase family protein [Bacteroidaceae bacterium]
MKILLFNQYAGNKGDRAVLFATCRMILQIMPNAEIIVSTSSPELYDGNSFYQQYNIKFVPNAWDYLRVGKHKIYWHLLRKIQRYTFTILREIYLNNFCFWLSRLFINPNFRKVVLEANRIISVGGHHYCTLLSKDLVSSINFDAMSILLQNKTFVCFSQTFGPFSFHNSRNERLTRKILSNCELYIREEESYQQLSDFHIPKSCIHATHETVISLNSIFPDYIKPSARNKIVGVSIYCTQKREKNKENEYMDNLVSLCRYIIKKGYKIHFFPMEIKHSLPDDRPFILKLVEKIDSNDSCLIMDVDMEPIEHLKEMSKCQLFIGHKTHSVIFALTAGTPLLAISYHPKTIAFMKQFNLQNYVKNEDDLSCTLLKNLFNKLENNMDLIGEMEFIKSVAFSKDIIEDFNKALLVYK